MKWMGGWTEQELANTSADLVDEIIAMINEEAEEMERRENER